MTSFRGGDASAEILISTDATGHLRVLIPSVDSSLAMKLLPCVLSLTAGSVDVISFLALGGLFTAHITGNLVILAAHVVSGGTAPLAPMLSVPVFIAVLGLVRLLAGALEAPQVATLRPFLGLQFILLSGFFVLCVTRGRRVDPDAPRVIVASMLGVAAMAVQNVLAQISLKGTPCDRSDDHQRHPLHDGCRLIGVPARPRRDFRGPQSSETHLVCDRRLCDRLWPRRGGGPCIRAVVPGAANSARPAGLRNEFGKKQAYS